MALEGISKQPFNTNNYYMNTNPTSYYHFPLSTSRRETRYDFKVLSEDLSTVGYQTGDSFYGIGFEIPTDRGNPYNVLEIGDIIPGIHLGIISIGKDNPYPNNAAGKPNFMPYENFKEVYNDDFVIKNKNYYYFTFNEPFIWDGESDIVFALLREPIEVNKPRYNITQLYNSGAAYGLSTTVPEGQNRNLHLFYAQSLGSEFPYQDNIANANSATSYISFPLFSLYGYRGTGNYLTEGVKLSLNTSIVSQIGEPVEQKADSIPYYGDKDNFKAVYSSLSSLEGGNHFTHIAGDVFSKAAHFKDFNDYERKLSAYLQLNSPGSLGGVALFLNYSNVYETGLHFAITEEGLEIVGYDGSARVFKPYPYKLNTWYLLELIPYPENGTTASYPYIPLLWDVNVYEVKTDKRGLNENSGELSFWSNELVQSVRYEINENATFLASQTHRIGTIAKGEASFDAILLRIRNPFFNTLAAPMLEKIMTEQLSLVQTISKDESIGYEAKQLIIKEVEINLQTLQTLYKNEEVNIDILLKVIGEWKGFVERIEMDLEINLSDYVDLEITRRIEKDMNL